MQTINVQINIDSPPSYRAIVSRGIIKGVI